MSDKQTSPITFEAAFLSYEEWLAHNPDADLQEEECGECGGDGVTECFHCGNEMECPACEGSGVVNTAHEQYLKQMEHDEEVLKKYNQWLQKTKSETGQEE